MTRLLWLKHENLATMAISFSLMSTSSDGKILVWRYNDKLRYPVKGHLLARKKGGELAIVGGTALSKLS